MTATERLYSQWLRVRNKEGKDVFERQLTAICIAACRKARLTPPFVYGDWFLYRKRVAHSSATRVSGYTLSEIRRSEATDPNPFWRGRFLLLSPWVRSWVNAELEREKPLRDGGRYIGRRCVCSLIDEIRSDQRRRRGAQRRVREHADDPQELKRLRSGMMRVLADAGLPGKLKIKKDREMVKKLMAAYPTKLSNVSLAREAGLSEGAIRKRRKRISQLCFALADGDYQLRSVLSGLGLKEGTKTPA